MSTALAPALIVWAFGLWSAGVVGSLTYGWVALMGGLPAGVAVWLTTHKRRMPEDRWYRLALAFVSFFSCVAWIYYFADLAVTLIDVRAMLIVCLGSGLPVCVKKLTRTAMCGQSFEGGSIFFAICLLNQVLSCATATASRTSPAFVCSPALCFLPESVVV